MKSGIYMVQLLNEEPIQMWIGDKRKPPGILLRAGDVKVGKAKDLEQRKKNYIKDFGYENVVFTVLIRTPDIAVAERVLLNNAEVKQYRLMSNSKRPRLLEWMRGINPNYIVNQYPDCV